MPSALVIEIGRHAKEHGVATDSGMDAPDPKEESDEGDAMAVKESAAEDVAKALGVDPKGVDLEALTQALSDFHEACAMGGYDDKQKYDGNQDATDTGE